MSSTVTDDGEVARVWMGQHFHQIKGAVTDALNGAHVDGPNISRERAGQLATLVMARMGHVYPDAPWYSEIQDALSQMEESDDPRGIRPGEDFR